MSSLIPKTPSSLGLLPSVSLLILHHCQVIQPIIWSTWSSLVKLENSCEPPSRLIGSKARVMPNGQSWRYWRSVPHKVVGDTISCFFDTQEQALGKIPAHNIEATLLSWKSSHISGYFFKSSSQKSFPLIRCIRALQPYLVIAGV